MLRQKIFTKTLKIKFEKSKLPLHLPQHGMTAPLVFMQFNHNNLWLLCVYYPPCALDLLGW